MTLSIMQHACLRGSQQILQTEAQDWITCASLCLSERI